MNEAAAHDVDRRGFLKTSSAAAGLLAAAPLLGSGLAEARPRAPTGTTSLPLGWANDQPVPLLNKLNNLAQQTDDWSKRKLYLLSIANFLFGQAKKGGKIRSIANEALLLADRSPYKLDQQTRPAYFNLAANLTQDSTDAKNSSFYYDYIDDSNPATLAFWVDFAAAYLGGGVFGSGFVQEEVMFTETPELANAAALGTLYTRSPQKLGVKQGSPAPLIIRGVHRTMQVSPTLSRSVLGNIPPGAMNAQADPYLGASLGFQPFNVLAMAAPDLNTQVSGKIPIDIIEDLFNTFVAGFRLAKYVADAQSATVTINTGRIGAGVFGNNIYCVHALQRLAAEYLKIRTIKFWGYGPLESTIATNHFNNIVKSITLATKVSDLLKIAAQENWTPNPA